MRPRALAAACPLIVPKRTFNRQCPLFQTIGLHAEAQPTWFESCTWTHFDPKPPIAILGNWSFIQGALPDDDPLSTKRYRQDDAMETTSHSRQSTPVEVGADVSSLPSASALLASALLAAATQAARTNLGCSCNAQNPAKVADANVPIKKWALQLARKQGPIPGPL